MNYLKFTSFVASITIAGCVTTTDFSNNNPSTLSPWVFSDIDSVYLDFNSGRLTLADKVVAFEKSPEIIVLDNIADARVTLPEYRINSWVWPGVTFRILDNVNLTVNGKTRVNGGSHRVEIQLQGENVSFSSFDYSTNMVSTNTSSILVEDPSIVAAYKGARHLAIGGFGLSEFMFPSNATAIYFQLDPRSTLDSPRSHFDNDRYLRFGLHKDGKLHHGTVFDQSTGVYFDLLRAIGVGHSLMSLTNFDDIYWGSSNGRPVAIEPSKGSDLLVSRNGQDVLTMWDSHLGGRSSSSVNLQQSIAIDGYGNRNEIIGFRFFEGAYDKPFYFTGDITDSVIMSSGREDVIHGGPGNETYAIDEQGINYDLAAGKVTDENGVLRATLSGIENVLSVGPLSVIGDDQDNVVFSHSTKGGRFTGNEGSDSLVFTPGVASAGITFDGGGGTDRIYVYAPLSEILVKDSEKLAIIGLTQSWRDAAEAYKKSDQKLSYDIAFSHGSIKYSEVEYLHAVDGTINLQTGQIEPPVSFNHLNSVVDPAIFRVAYSNDQFSQVPNSPFVGWFQAENSLNIIDHHSSDHLSTGNQPDVIVNRKSASINSSGGNDRILFLGSQLDLNLGDGDDIVVVESTTPVSGSIHGGRGTDVVVWQKYADFIASDSNIRLNEVEVVLVLDHGLLIVGSDSFNLSAALVLPRDRLNPKVSEKLKFVSKRITESGNVHYTFVDEARAAKYLIELDDGWLQRSDAVTQIRQ